MQHHDRRKQLKTKRPKDGGNWGRFDVDAGSHWVRLTDDYGVPQQASCTGSADCNITQMFDMGSDYGNAYSFATEHHGDTDISGNPVGTPSVRFNFGVYNYFHFNCGDNKAYEALDSWASSAAPALAWAAAKSGKPQVAAFIRISGTALGFMSIARAGVDRAVCRQ
jgi:hypothetical protein